MTEYYKTLGLTSDATLEEVKTAYRKLSKKFHPDVNNGDKYFEERFKEIQLAYEKIVSEKTKTNSNFSQTKSEEKQSENKTQKPNDYNNQEKKEPTKKSNYSKVFIPAFIIILIAIFKPIIQKSIRENAKEDLMKTYENPSSYENETTLTNYENNIIDSSVIDNSNNELINIDSTYNNEVKLEDNSTNRNKPSLKESLSWLLAKLNQYKADYTVYSEPGPFLPTHSKYFNFNYSINEADLIVTYDYEFYEKYVDEQTLRNYYNANMSKETALSLSKEYRATKSYRYKEIIPLNKIDYTYYDKDKDYNGKCDFSVSTKKNVITRYNISTGEKNFTSYFKFVYDCSQEDNLGNRINDALTHIKNINPVANNKSNEAF